MSKEIGTLVVVVLKARNLPDPHSIYKQDVYTEVKLNGKTKQTGIDVKGGQHPMWDEELRFPIYNDQDKVMEVACWRKESRGSEVIGQGKVDVSDTLRTGEFDDWVNLEENGAYRGELYLEMTYYAASPPPLQRRKTKMPMADRLTRTSQPYLYPGVGSTQGQAPAKTPPKSSSPPRNAQATSRYPRTTNPNPSSLLAPPGSTHTSPQTSPRSRHDTLPPIPPDADTVPAALRPGHGEYRSSIGAVPESLRPGNLKADVHYSDKPHPAGFPAQTRITPPHSPPQTHQRIPSGSAYVPGAVPYASPSTSPQPLYAAPASHRVSLSTSIPPYAAAAPSQASNYRSSSPSYTAPAAAAPRRTSPVSHSNIPPAAYASHPLSHRSSYGSQPSVSPTPSYSPPPASHGSPYVPGSAPTASSYASPPPSHNNSYGAPAVGGACAHSPHPPPHSASSNTYTSPAVHPHTSTTPQYASPPPAPYSPQTFPYPTASPYSHSRSSSDVTRVPLASDQFALPAHDMVPPEHAIHAQAQYPLSPPRSESLDGPISIPVPSIPHYEQHHYAPSGDYGYPPAPAPAPTHSVSSTYQSPPPPANYYHPPPAAPPTPHGCAEYTIHPYTYSAKPAPPHAVSPPPKPVPSARYTQPLPLPDEPDGMRTPTPAHPQPQPHPKSSASPSLSSRPAHPVASTGVRKHEPVEDPDEVLARRLEEEEEARKREAEARERKDEELARKLDLELNLEREDDAEGSGEHAPQLPPVSMTSLSAEMPGSWESR